MTTSEDRPPDHDPSPGWVTPPSAAPTDRRGWALPALVLGIVCLVVVAIISANYFIGQSAGDPPSLALAYTFMAGPFLLVGLPLVLVGSFGWIRPWSGRRQRLRVAVPVAAIGLFVVALRGPGLLFTKPVTLGTGSVSGLPGQTSAWSGAVECTWSDRWLRVVAGVPGSTLSRDALSTSRYPQAADLADKDGAAYEIHLDVYDEETDLTVWSGDFGSPSEAASVAVEPGKARGRFVSEPDSILHFDDPPSIVDVTWDCPTP